MNTEAAERRLREAETALVGAERRLRAVRDAALYGFDDPAALDAASEAYCRAAHEAAAAAGALALSRQAPRAEASPRVDEVTPRMRFVRWLVETGRLSDDLPPPAS
jgi:hypothetical protein